ncbi:MAG TPA: hypothetical protein VKB65_01580 [Myxococcota bacterium]|nr:hypothetical protein [Myxococcota bacterium]
MKMEKRFEVGCDRDRAVEIAGQEETLLSLFPDGRTEIVDRRSDRVTARTHYTALGREGTATFHFDYLMDGNVRFEKVCDGNVWRELRGELEFDERGGGCVVTLRLEGSTKSLVPEFTIRGPMKEQIEQMADALRRRIEH